MAEPRAKAKAREREREIERQMQQLGAADPAARRAAALYLGEAAATDAVDELIDVYETDDDRRVRRAAAYALGQFKAIDKAMARGRREHVEKLLKRVEVDGRLGGRAPTGAAVQVLVMLLVLLGILSAALLFAPQIRAQFGEVAEVVSAVSAPRRERPTLIAETEAYYDAINADNQALFGEYQTLLGGAPIRCAATFRNAPAYLVHPEDAAANPDVAAVVTRLNAQRDVLLNARIAYDEACAGTRTLTAAESGALLQPLVPVTQTLADLRSDIDALLGIATATPTPDANALTTTAAADLRTIVDAMTAPQGAAVLLVQYWTEAGTNGQTAGCQTTSPPFPADVVLAPEIAATAPNLAQAALQVNTGLAAVRNGWNQLAASCAENAVATQARAGLTNAQAAVASFELARGLLDLVAQGQP